MLSNNRILKNTVTAALIKAAPFLFSPLFVLIQAFYTLVATLRLELLCAYSAPEFIRINALIVSPADSPDSAQGRETNSAERVFAGENVPSPLALPDTVQIIRTKIQNRIAQKISHCVRSHTLVINAVPDTHRIKVVAGESYRSSTLSQLYRRSTA